MNVSELRILEIALWVFAASFAVKCVVFGWLSLSLRGSRDVTSLGRSIKWHYISLSAQAAVLTLFYTYYASAAGGNGQWLDEHQRVTVYIVGAALATWATAMGIRLMIAYRSVMHRQDARDVQQDQREDDWDASHDDPDTVSGLKPDERKYMFRN